VSDRPENGAGQLISSIGALDAVEDEWRALAESRGNAFITPEWFRSWHGQYGAGQTPAVVVVRSEDGSIRGVVPLVGDLGGFPRRVRFAGANLGDHLQPAATLQNEVEVAAAAGRAVAEAGRWSMVVLDNVEVGAAWAREMVAAGGLKSDAHRQAALPHVNLSEFGSWEVYLASRSRNFRSQIGRFRRRLEREHQVEFRRTSDPARLAEELDTFFRLHDARWASKGGSSSAGERARRFHFDFAARALERGWLRLWTLDVDGEPAAAWYGWLLGGRYAYYLAGFDPRWSDQRVGLILLAHTVRSAFEEGADEYDMLLGEEPYKDRFASSQRQVETVLATPARHPARALAATEVSVWRLARRLPEHRRLRLREALGSVAKRLPGERSR